MKTETLAAMQTVRENAWFDRGPSREAVTPEAIMQSAQPDTEDRVERAPPRKTLQHKPPMEMAKIFSAILAEEDGNSSAAREVFEEFQADLAQQGFKAPSYEAFAALRDVENRAVDALKNWRIVQNAATTHHKPPMEMVKIFNAILAKEDGYSSAAREVFEEFQADLAQQGFKAPSYEAFAALRDVENRAVDALKNWRIVQNAATTHHKPPMEMVKIFNAILAKEDGYSSAAREVFEEFQADLAQQGFKAPSYEAFAALRDVENRAVDALKNWRIVQSAATTHHKPPMEMVKIFNAILAKEDGYSSAAREVFEEFQADLAQQGFKAPSYEAFAALRDVENRAVDALKNWRIVQSAATRSNKPPMEMAKIFNAILAEEDGRPAAREVFEEFAPKAAVKSELALASHPSPSRPVEEKPQPIPLQAEPEQAEGPGGLPVPQKSLVEKAVQRAQKIRNYELLLMKMPLVSSELAVRLADGTFSQKDLREALEAYKRMAKYENKANLIAGALNGGESPRSNSSELAATRELYELVKTKIDTQDWWTTLAERVKDIF